MQDIKISIFRDLFKAKDLPHITTLNRVAERIKQGSSKELIEKIRATDNKEVRNQLKLKLPSIIFSGEFKERNAKGLLKHSGLMVLDFDNYPTELAMLHDLKKLCKIKHFVMLFISPSGNGIKGVIKVSKELTKETHPKVYKAFQKQYKFQYLDEITNNVDRVCFESYDPTIYVNYNAEIYDPKIVDEGFVRNDQVALVPINDEFQIIEKIMKFNFKKDFVQGQRNAYIFDVASMMCEYGVSESTCFQYLWNNVIHGDFKQHEAKRTIKSAYQTRNFNIKYFENYQKIQIIKNDLKTSSIDEIVTKHKVDEKVVKELNNDKKFIQFWYIETDKKGNEKIHILPIEYKKYLELNGYSKYYPNGSQNAVFVKITNYIVCETSVQKIKDFVLNDVLNRGFYNVYSYLTKYAMLFTESFLTMLETIELIMLKDTKQKTYLTYENGVLEVTENDVKLRDYYDFQAYVWHDNIIGREFHVNNDISNDYQTFINNISKSKPKPIECTIGYLLCNYKDKMNNKAIILNDEVISDNPEGGTGKGLLVQGLKQVRKVSILDGKSFDDRKSFPYQTVSQDTNILVFDDVQKSFNFESKFSLVTEGITLERKNKDAIKLTVEDSPKLCISTNYAIKGEGNSHNRRRHEIELAQYYNGDLTPFDEFGHQLFDDWSSDHFNRFDNYIVYCIQQYLKNGLLQQDAVNINLRKLIAETSMEFYEWIEDADNFPRNTYNNKQQKYFEFTEEYQDFKKWLSRKRFAIWVQKYANFKGLKYNQGVSQGGRWFELQDDNKTEDNEIPF